MMRTTRRMLGALVAATSALGVLGVLGAVGHASATPAPTPAPAPHVDPLTLAVDEEYWACVALDHVEVGTCIENPLPDLSDVDDLEGLLGALLGGRA